MKVRRVAILGSTGSIGRQALEVIAADPGLSAVALSAGSNWRLLAEQAGRFGPEAVAVADPVAGEALRSALPEGVALLAGPEAAEQLIRRVRPDMVLTAMVGACGLGPTLAAIECGADLAIANKESLVMGGGVVMPAARAAGVKVLPVDSEHSAVFQCLAGQRRGEVRRVILTASGGPLRRLGAQQVYHATLAEVLNHPTWQMGPKVTIDSATLMNKALEVIEAHWLFDLAGEQIEVVIHPESLVHACVEFVDGSVLAQLARPAMTTPIAYALRGGRRSPRAAVEPLDLAEAGRLTFEPVDRRRWPAVELGYEVLRRGGTAGAVLNAANEVAVEAFVAGTIPFGRITEVAREVLQGATTDAEVSLETILAADEDARRRARQAVAGGG